MDHARRLNTRFEFPAFRDQILKCFKDDGLHDLVIALRILLHHLHVVKQVGHFGPTIGMTFAAHISKSVDPRSNAHLRSFQFVLAEIMAD